MHTWSSEEERDWRPITILHNSDFSGNVKIVIPRSWLKKKSHYDSRGLQEPHLEKYGDSDETAWEVELPFAILRDVVLDVLRSKIVSNLENASYDDLERALCDTVITSSAFSSGG